MSYLFTEFKAVSSSVGRQIVGIKDEKSAIQTSVEKYR